MPIYEFPKNKTVHCIDCGCEMDAGLSCYTFEGKPICTYCEKERYRKYVESLPPVKIIQTTCKACGAQIGIFEKEKPFRFDCLCEFIYKVGKRNKEQMNIFEVTNG
jgi:hypothetical protein